MEVYKSFSTTYQYHLIVAELSMLLVRSNFAKLYVSNRDL